MGNDWYVDDRCTNCDVARQLAPGLIEEVGGRSEIVRQPRDATDLARLNAAAFACHTRSIRRHSRSLDAAADPFPLALDENVMLCGHNSRHTAAANSYLLRRPSGTLMMVDTPRWSDELATRYEALGQVTDVLLTHRDHAAHGRRYADRFGARLWIHAGDLAAAPDADRVLRGIEPAEIADGVIVHPLPGHTEGSVLYVADERYCFSGDSIYWSRTKDALAVAEHVTWYSIKELAASLARTAPLLRFEWMLPGHGDRKQLAPEEMAAQLRALTAHTRQLEPQSVDFTAHQW
ncbi:MBL fold metallo-hydrolase [Kitasatospora sp. MAP5-34]|uniref:MBL fold metallo-hydrolase n=1 Tax=Kitasatospora sp. MAP5-34 TaxID=3035102 RepID=UPI0024759396|nr:MBL fold metallo-hydrolase [Kitasatospora sp. MAP5-34]MDH6576548.1 glyoxylase-like metal-dependent hydrolase (beta-lactamase superfamily II) [Kitasatospora sp. MAP5-34]